MKIRNIVTGFIIVTLFSCNNNRPSKDATMEALVKLPQEKYSKIECPFEIDMDTISINKIETNLVIKNIGKNQLTNLFVKTTCDCTALEDYPTELKPNESTSIKVTVDIDKKGYFSKTLYVFGSFNPTVRMIHIVGYKM
jgi:Protein of unknown function (DUF1573)